MSHKNMTPPQIHNRKDLFDFLQKQMDSSFTQQTRRRSSGEESYKVKSYILEANVPGALKDESPNEPKWEQFLSKIFTHSESKTTVHVQVTDELGFFEVSIPDLQPLRVILYLDTTTNARFWYLFTVSKSEKVDDWIDRIMKESTTIDRVWFWPAFLEDLQQRGKPRGFGIDYDFRKFEKGESEKTTYLKMQLWGGQETKKLYESLLEDPNFQDKIVLSKVRVKESSHEDGKELFALQDIKYTGKFTSAGNDLDTHLATLSFARSEYARKINHIEETHSLKWVEKTAENLALEGYALHFIPRSGVIDVDSFLEYVLDGTEPFRLFGFQREVFLGYGFVAQVVDLHTGGKFHIEAYPDQMTVYLPAGTCGNTIVRFFTNLQHYYSRSFDVESDNGEPIF